MTTHEGIGLRCAEDEQCETGLATSWRFRVELAPVNFQLDAFAPTSLECPVPSVITIALHGFARMTTTLRELISGLNAEVIGDDRRPISGAGSIETAGPSDLAFVGTDIVLRRMRTCQAAAVVIAPSLVEPIQAKFDVPALVVVEDAFDTFLQLLLRLRPPRPGQMIGLSEKAHVSDSANIGDDTNIHAGAHINDDVVIGNRCTIHAGVVVAPGCQIGDDVTLHPHVVLYADVTVGDRVIIHANSVIGADGFGYRQKQGRHEKIPHVGSVRIEDDVEIGACSTIDRGMMGATVIGAGTKIDNQVMVAHNCQLGRHNILASQVGFAGSVTTGDYVICAGQVGVADHVQLGEHCIIGSQSGINHNLAANGTYMGTPAQPLDRESRAMMAYRKLPEMRRTVKDLQKQLAELNRRISQIESGRAQSTQDERPAA